MKTFIKLTSSALAGICLFSAVSCIGNWHEKVTRKTYIVSYYQSVKYLSGFHKPENKEMPYISVKMDGAMEIDILGIKYSDRKAEIFDSLSRKNNDTSYPESKLRLIPGEAKRDYPNYTAHDIEAVDIVSDNDFCGVTAGQSLAAMVRLTGFSCDEYIEAGYKSVYDYTDKAGLDKLSEAFKTSMKGFLPNAEHPLATDRLSCLYPTDKPLSEITVKDLKLLGSGYRNDIFNLVFETVPETDEIHTFTISIKGDNGENYKTTVKVQFN